MSREIAFGVGAVFGILLLAIMLLVFNPEIRYVPDGSGTMCAASLTIELPSGPRTVPVTGVYRYKPNGQLDWVMARAAHPKGGRLHEVPPGSERGAGAERGGQ